ncbi:MAG: hypothetical protein KF745_13810 [Phycisphaeraceae bacterium]|nr:hypothetical protein [Phycisphaeraceae bacterium]
MNVAVGDDEAVGSEAEPSAAAGEVREQRSCFECGYDLVGLPIAGECPECGLAVAESLREGLLLRDARPRWVRHLRLGYSMLEIGLAVLATVLLVSCGNWEPGGIVFGALWTLGVTASVVVSVGCLLVTMPEGLAVDVVWPDAARRVLRAASLGMAVAVPVRVIPVYAGEVEPWSWWGPLTLATYFLWGFQFVAMMRYTRWLAGRVPDRWLAAGATAGVWVVPVVFVGGVYRGILMSVAVAMWCGVAAWMRLRLGRGRSA